MGAWASELYELPQDHGWIAKPGYKILVLDRGAVALEFPAAWTVQPGAQQTDIRDQPSAAQSSCVLAVSYLRLPPADWSDLPLAQLLGDALRADDRERIGRGAVVIASRAGLEIVWTVSRVVDPGERREARCRVCLARGARIQCLITLDFWPEDETRHAPVWDHMLSSLRLGARVDDPALGRRIG
ncbi:MAG: hypothetical protein ACREMV_05855 [Gemmatimonadales bacterium]